METTLEEQIAGIIGRTVHEKGKAYGDPYLISSTSIMKILYPLGIDSGQLSDALVILRMVDKLCRIALGDPLSDKEDPWQDITGYGIRKIVARSIQNAANVQRHQHPEAVVDPSAEQHDGHSGGHHSKAEPLGPQGPSITGNIRVPIESEPHKPS